MKTESGNAIFSLRNLFLYLVAILLPVFLAWFALRNMINEQYFARLETARSRLDIQSPLVPRYAKPEYQILDLFNGFDQAGLAKKSPEIIARTIDHIDSLYPGAFKWLFWGEDGKLLPLRSSALMQGRRSWEGFIKYLMISGYFVANAHDVRTNFNFDDEVTLALKTLQRAIGNRTKVEHLSHGNRMPIQAQWLGREATFAWTMDVRQVGKRDSADEISGGFMMVVFNDALEEHFWLRRMVERRPSPQSQIPLPVVALDISTSRAVAVDPVLRSPGLVGELLEAYKSRSSRVFEFGSYLARASTPEPDASIRLVSVADISPEIFARDRYLLWLNLIFILLLILSFPGYRYLRSGGFAGLALRKRIAGLFLVSVLMPVVALVTIGRSFVEHEENRLIESAYVSMRKSLEALELRYIDTPRLIEKKLFEQLDEYLGEGPHSIVAVEQKLDKALEEGLMENYYVMDESGRFVSMSWDHLHEGIKKGLEYSSRSQLQRENRLGGIRSSVLQNALDEELEAILGDINMVMDLSRHAHLRHFVVGDTHMYFMAMLLRVDEKLMVLYIHLVDPMIERAFVRQEYSLNRFAGNTGETDAHSSELFFYSQSVESEHLPENIELWELLRDIFERSHKLKTEESGRVRIANETFLYLVRPLASMNTQGYTPCLLTSTRQIETRLVRVRLVVGILAAAASLGAFIMSLILTSSLLMPIQQLDNAARKVGGGDLNVKLPVHGSDEISSLSRAFNDMVKGLRERERMQAYVSESVIEAVQDSSDSHKRDGKIVEATILFSDIRNFTGISEQYAPDTVFELLNDFLGGVESIIRNSNGRVDKFIGDAVMAVFLDADDQNHALNAVKAAVEMKTFVKNLNYKREKKGLFKINIGIGISTGKVLLGSVGSSKRKDLTVIGDEVNLAARLEAASKKGRHSRIVVSGVTYGRVRDLVEAEEMPFQEVRGKKQPVRIYELVKLL